jgi:hypothetical protein
MRTQSLKFKAQSEIQFIPLPSILRSGATAEDGLDGGGLALWSSETYSTG